MMIETKNTQRESFVYLTAREVVEILLVKMGLRCFSFLYSIYNDFQIQSLGKYYNNTFFYFLFIFNLVITVIIIRLSTIFQCHHSHVIIITLFCCDDY